MELWFGADSVILVDAVRSDSPPGTIHVLDAARDTIPQAFFHSSSTHAFGVAEAVELAKTLGSTPQKFLVYGIEGKCFDVGTELSPEVKLAAEEVARKVYYCTSTLVQYGGVGGGI
jgi:hydrogenase maturation protease